MSEMNNCLNVIDENGRLIWHRKFQAPWFDRLQRLLELLPDEESLNVLDIAIRILEAPKIELALKISRELTKNGNMVDFLKEALTALPKKQLEEMNKKLSSLKIKREPGGDCLIINDGEKYARINL